MVEYPYRRYYKNPNTDDGSNAWADIYQDSAFSEFRQTSFYAKQLFEEARKVLGRDIYNTNPDDAFDLSIRTEKSDANEEPFYTVIKGCFPDLIEAIRPIAYRQTDPIYNDENGSVPDYISISITMDTQSSAIDNFMYKCKELFINYLIKRWLEGQGAKAAPYLEKYEKLYGIALVSLNTYCYSYWNKDNMKQFHKTLNHA